MNRIWHWILIACVLLYTAVFWYSEAAFKGPESVEDEEAALIDRGKSSGSVQIGSPQLLLR
ncbi:MAG: hypothetical protein WCY54_09430 [Syntrophales bacterium]